MTAAREVRPPIQLPFSKRLRFGLTGIAACAHHRGYAGRVDPLRSTPRIWARLTGSPNTWWHRIAWQRHTGDHVELVALCGLAIRKAAAEQSDARDAPGSVCHECAIVMDLRSTALGVRVAGRNPQPRRGSRANFSTKEGWGAAPRGR